MEDYDLELREQLIGGTVLQFLHAALFGHSQDVINIKLTDQYTHGGRVKQSHLSTTFLQHFILNAVKGKKVKVEHLL